MEPIAMHVGPSLEDRIETAVSCALGLIRQGFSLALTLSSGKDSSTTTLICCEAIRRAKEAGIQQATHFISSSSTAVENPEIEDSLLSMHADIESWAQDQGLPLEVHLVHPAHAAKFAVSTLGRGTLPRFVENGAKRRSCSDSWKVQPQKRLAKSLTERSLANGFKETITVLGTRFSESTVRGSAMRSRNESAAKPVRSEDGFLTLSLIADWPESMVWEFLAQFLLPETTPFPSAFAGPDTVRRMLDLYRDGNSGVCGMFLGDGQKAPCGSRWGCWTCTITGERDKSMESLIESGDRYDYLRGLNAFRNFLIDTQWDMSRRELIGRTLSPAGYLGVRPDVYNLSMRRDLLGYLLTLDVLEVERAEKLDGDVASGAIESNAWTERMRYPQFETISITDIVLIDFYWSMHSYAPTAFPALTLWWEVKHLGRRFKIPKIERTPAGKIPEKRWFYVGAFDAQAPTDGLRDYGAEMWNPYLHPERPLVSRCVDGEKTVWFEESDQLEVDASKACEVVDTFCTTPMAIESGGHSAMESARFWLNQEVIKLPAGMAARYQHMAKRGQYFAHLAERLRLTPVEMNHYLEVNSISDQEHNLLTERALEDQRIADDLQLQLFAA